MTEQYRYFKHTGHLKSFSGHPIVTNGDLGVQFRAGITYNLGISKFLKDYEGYFDRDGLVTLRFKMVDKGLDKPIYRPTGGRYPCKRILRGTPLVDSILMVNSVYKRTYQKKFT